MQINLIGKETIEELAEGSHLAFQQVFSVFYPKVHAFAQGFIKNEADADDISQTVFINLWTKRESLSRVDNLDAYIYTIAKHTVLNYIAQRKAFTIDIARLRNMGCEGATPQEQIEASDMKLLIDMIVQQMPPQRQTIYRMSREEGLDNDAIAERLGLQKKTVENHLNLALGDIRKMLKILILLLLSWG